MPLNPLRIAIVVGPGPGAPAGPDHSIAFTLEADGVAGFQPTAAQGQKLSQRLQALAAMVDENQSKL